MYRNTLLCVTLALSFCCATLQAQDMEKLDALKERLKEYAVGAPRPNFAQKTAFCGIWRLHRDSIREIGQKIRAEVIGARREFRQNLTREQLLHILDLRDELSMRPPVVRAMIALKKLDPQDRVHLLQLARRLWQGDKPELEANLDALHSFFREKICPIAAQELSLTEEQRAEGARIIEQTRERVRPLVVELFHKIFTIRALGRAVLTDEQRAYIDANRDKVFQEVLDFVSSL